MNLNPDKFSSSRVGAYCIRPTDGHARGRTKLIPIRFLIPRIKTNQTAVHFPVRSTIVMVVCGAYAIRPYTNDKSLVQFSRSFGHLHDHLWGVCCCALHGHPKKWRSFYPRIKMNIKPDGFSIPRTKRNLILIRFSNPRPKMNLNLAGFFNPGPKGIAIPGA